MSDALINIMGYSSEETSLSHLKWVAKTYPPSTEECDVMLEGMRLMRFVLATECQDCNLACEDHSAGWLFPTTVCLKDAIKHGYKKFIINQLKEEGIMEDTENKTPVTKAGESKVIEAIPESVLSLAATVLAEALESEPGNPGKVAVTQAQPVKESTPAPAPAPAATATVTAAEQKPAAPVELKPPTTPLPIAPIVPKIHTKILIEHDGMSALVGIQREGCDPLFFNETGGLVTIMGKLPQLLAQAGMKWKTAPKNPKAAEIVTPAAPVASTSTKPAPATATKPVTPAEPKPGEMKSMM